jgi:hypothetical protein
MASVQKRGRVWYYRFVDADGVRRNVKGCTDRRVTEELARNAESETAMIKAGRIDPRELAYRDHEARPLAEHLNDWHGYLTAKGSTVKHANLASYRARRVVQMARIGRLSDLTPSRVQ